LARGSAFREEVYGGARDGFYAVADGPLWWLYDPRIGVRSNQDDPRLGSNIGEELAVMLDPTPLLGLLRFRPVGRSNVAGRPTLSSLAWPRRIDAHDRPLPDELAQLGLGAQEYQLEIDFERGVLLSATGTCQVE